MTAKKKTTKKVSAYDLLAEVSAQIKSDKIRSLETELNIDPNGYIELDLIRKYHITFVEDESCGETRIEGNEVYLNTCRKKVNEIIFEFWKLIAKQLPELRKNIAKADNYLRNSKIEVLHGFLDELLEDMASDEYAINKVPDISLISIEALIPFVTMSSFGTYESDDVKNIVKRRLKDENALVMIRRDYLNMIKGKLENELKGTPVKRMSLLEKKRLSESLEQEAAERGFGSDTRTPSKAPMVTVCKNLGVKVSDSDSFEKCVKTVIKVFTREEMNKNDFTISKKEDLEELHRRVVPIVKEFLQPHFKKYITEISMSKRGPLRELMVSVMRDVADNKATLATIDVVGTYERIITNDDTVTTQIKKKLNSGEYKTAKEWEQLKGGGLK